MVSATVSNSIRRDRYTIYLYIALAFFGFSQAVLGSVTPFLRHEMGLSTVLIGWHFTVYAIGLVSSAKVIHRLPQNFRTENILRYSATAMVLIILSIGLAPTPIITLVLSFCLGLFGGAVQISIQSALANHHGENQGIALMEAFVFAALGVAIAPLTISFIASTELFSWRVALALPATFLPLVFIFFRQEIADSTSIKNYRSQAEDSEALPKFILLMLSMIVFGIAAEWGLGFWGAQFLEAKLLLLPHDAVRMMSAYFGGTLVGRIIMSRLLRVYTAGSLLLFLIVLGGVSLTAVALSSHVAASWIILFIAGSCLGNFYPLILSLANESAPGRLSDVSRVATLAVGAALVTAPDRQIRSVDWFDESIWAVGHTPCCNVGFVFYRQPQQTK